MRPLQAHTLYDLAAGAYAAATAAQATDDIEQRYGLLAAVEQLTGELKRIAWEYCEDAAPEDLHPRIRESIVRALNPDSDLGELAAAIAQATGEAITPDQIRLIEANGDPDGWLIADKASGDFLWHVTVDGRLTKQAEPHLDPNREFNSGGLDF